MKNESSNVSSSWKIDGGKDGTLYRTWRFFSNISDSLLLDVTIHKVFSVEINNIQKKLRINAKQITAGLLKKPFIRNTRVLYFVLRYINGLPKDGSGYVTGHDCFIQEYDGLGSKEPEFLQNEETALLLKDLALLSEFENEIVNPDVDDEVKSLLSKYHLSYRYYRRIKSILLYNDFPPVPTLWKLDRNDYNDDSVGTLTIRERKEIDKMNRAIKRTLETGVSRTPITYIDKDKKYIVIEVYPDTSLDIFSMKEYKNTLKDLQKSLLGYRRSGLSYEGYESTIYNYLSEVLGMSQKAVLSKIKKIYGKKYVKGFDSEQTAKASTKKRRYQKKYLEDITE